MEKEEGLILRAREGDRQAMEEIYRGCCEGVYRYAYWSTGSREDAEDITSEAFYRAFKHLGRYDPSKASFSTWVMRIAHNLVADSYRKKARHPQVELPPDLAWEGEVGDALEAEDERRVLMEAMRELTEEQRQVLVLKYFMQMGNREVGRVMGRREGAVNALHHRALWRLGLILEREGAAPQGRGAALPQTENAPLGHAGGKCADEGREG